MSVKLLPCPFCGGEAKFVKTSDEIVPVRVELVAWNVKCSRCFASPLPNNYEGSKEAAAERWNRRAERTCRVEVERRKLSQTQTAVVKSCSECGFEFGVETENTFPFEVTINAVEPPNFCPNCGARVIEEGAA